MSQGSAEASCILSVKKLGNLRRFLFFSMDSDLDRRLTSVPLIFALRHLHWRLYLHYQNLRLSHLNTDWPFGVFQ